MSVGGHVCVCGVDMLICHAYLHMPRLSEKIHRNLTALVASGKRGGNYFSLYIFCTF